MPDIRELVPAYAYAQARSEMDRAESLVLDFSHSGDWSDNVLRDAAWYIRQIQARFRSPSYFHRGERTRAKMALPTRKVDYALDERLPDIVRGSPGPRHDVAPWLSHFTVCP